MRKLQILLPLAGAGSRFTNGGFTIPKPLIPVDGKPMVLKSISSLDSIKIEKRYIFIIRQEHTKKDRLDKLILQELPEADIIIIPKLTRGAVETCLSAKPKLDPEDGLIIMDCDLWFNSQSYNKMVIDSLTGVSDIDGGLLTFRSNNPRYSYARLNNEGAVVETAEKRVISNNAITGAYFFKTADKFIKSAEKMLAQPLGEKMPEYYTSLLYNILINEGDKIKAASVDEFASFGTPEELESYQKHSA